MPLCSFEKELRQRLPSQDHPMRYFRDAEIELAYICVYLQVIEKKNRWRLSAMLWLSR